MTAKRGKKTKRPQTTAFENTIGTPARGNEEITAGQNPDEIAERGGTNVELKG